MTRSTISRIAIVFLCIVCLSIVKHQIFLFFKNRKLFTLASAQRFGSRCRRRGGREFPKLPENSIACVRGGNVPMHCALSSARSRRRPLIPARKTETLRTASTRAKVRRGCQACGQPSITIFFPLAAFLLPLCPWRTFDSGLEKGRS